VPDLIDTLLNFLYIVGFLAAMILPAFQRQRREAARQRAEEQRRAQDIPTVEERSPEDVPDPVIRRSAAPAAEAASEVRAAAPVAPPSRVAEPEAAAVPEVAAAAAQSVGGNDLTQLDEEIDLTALDEAIDVTAFDDAVPQLRLTGEMGGSSSPADERESSAAGRRRPLDRAALRQAIVWRELLDRPVALRSGRRDS
jgi:hypothetical protein